MSISSDIYFHTRMQRQTSVASAALLLAECAEARGWNLAAFHAEIGRHDLPRDRAGEFIATSMGWRVKTVSDWVSLELARNCPLSRHCGECAEPFLWDCDTDSTAWYGRPLLPDQQAVMHHYGQDVCGGVTVPVHRQGRTGYVSWCTRDHERLERGYHATLSSIHLISHTFMRQIDRLADIGVARDGAAKNPLTPREIECLTWAARGKTTCETAAILHRSSETVDFHLSNAMVKLNAKNRAHAVAIACRRELIGEV